MMNKIFASTLYKASTNKEHIKSALANPKNTELVQQLREYLDDETLEQLNPPEVDFTIPEDTEVDTVEDDTGAGSVVDGGDASVKSPASRPSPAKFTSKESHMDDLKEFESGIDETIPEPSSDSDNESSEPQESSEPVEGAVDVDDADEQIDTNAIQGSLNSREDTSGVSYIVIKDNELWIHYKDNVNLNNVMESVIKWFRDNCYDNLTFNRLARAANAIVFEIVDTNINNYSMSKEDN